MSDKEMKVLIFSLNGEHYATDIMEVERILGYEEPTKLPDAPSFVEGVINHEGNILPIMNLAKRFKLIEKEYSKDSKIIVARQGGSKIGVVVDLVTEVKDITEENIEAAPEIVSGISRRYIKGLIKTDGKIIIFLNLATILSDEEKQLIF